MVSLMVSNLLQVPILLWSRLREAAAEQSVMHLLEERARAPCCMWNGGAPEVIYNRRKAAVKTKQRHCWNYLRGRGRFLAHLISLDTYIEKSTSCAGFLPGAARLSEVSIAQL